MIKASLNRASQTMNKMMVRGLSYYLINDKLPVPTARKRFAQVNSLATMPSGVLFREETIASIPTEVVTPDLYDGKRCLFYLHGGGFCLGSPKTHRELTGWLSKTLHTKVIVPQYRLAPENPYPAGLDDGIAVYQALLASGESTDQMMIGGDSAGGNLALVLLLRMKELGLPLPSAAIFYSPWVDLRCTSESYYTKKDHDPLLSGSWLRRMREHYRNAVDVNHHEISPVHADLSGLPPMLIHVGGNEVLLNDALLLDQNVRAHQGNVHLKVWDELWHVFHAHVQYLEIARQALLETRDFVNQSLVMKAK